MTLIGSCSLRRLLDAQHSCVIDSGIKTPFGIKTPPLMHLLLDSNNLGAESLALKRRLFRGAGIACGSRVVERGRWSFSTSPASPRTLSRTMAVPIAKPSRASFSSSPTTAGAASTALAILPSASLGTSPSNTIRDRLLPEQTAPGERGGAPRSGSNRTGSLPERHRRR